MWRVVGSCLFVVSFVVLGVGASAHAQLPSCTGQDSAGASAEFEAGNALLTQAIDQASHRHVDRAHELATQALARFDRQCELGDTSAFAERGAALLLLGEILRSAQSYDAYLAVHPLDSLDARTRRRIEPNLQPGTITLEVQNPQGHVFVNDLDFGALPRTTALRVPLGDYRIEARDADGNVLTTAETSLTADAPISELHMFVPLPSADVPATIVTDDTPPPVVPPSSEEAPAHTDFLPFYIASAITAGVGLAVGVGFVIAADERARTYNQLCYPTMIAGCGSVLSERDTFIALTITGFVVGGIGIAGLVTSWILDSSQPRGHVRVAFGPTSISLSGEF